MGTPASAKLRAAAVYPMVSVPWVITTPSAPSRTALFTRRASFDQWLGVMFSENMSNMISGLTSATSESTGTRECSSA